LVGVSGEIIFGFILFWVSPRLGRAIFFPNSQSVCLNLLESTGNKIAATYGGQKIDF